MRIAEGEAPRGEDAHGEPAAEVQRLGRGDRPPRPVAAGRARRVGRRGRAVPRPARHARDRTIRRAVPAGGSHRRDRKSTRLNSSHVRISYAVFCLKKKKTYFDSQLYNKKKK